MYMPNFAAVHSEADHNRVKDQYEAEIRRMQEQHAVETKRVPDLNDCIIAKKARL